MVEDDAPLRELYRGSLSAQRYRVLSASDGLSALEIIERDRPDVVVLDLGLPLVSGWDVYRELRSRAETKKIRVVIVTGNDLQDIREQDVVSFLQKPVDPDAVSLAVDEAVRRSHW